MHPPTLRFRLFAAFFFSICICAARAQGVASPDLLYIANKVALSDRAAGIGKRLPQTPTVKVAFEGEYGVTYQFGLKGTF